jgi:hypothetical protein
VTVEDEGSDAAVPVTWMDSSTRQFLLEAGQSAPLRYPGAVGELLSQELFSWMVFGHQLGSDLIMRVATEVLAEDTRLPRSTADRSSR